MPNVTDLKLAELIYVEAAYLSTSANDAALT